MSAFNYAALVAEAKESGQSTTYEPLPDGSYEVQIDKVDATNSKKGDPQLVIAYKVLTEGFVNRKLWHRMTFIPGNAIGTAINLRQLDVMGATPLMEQGASLAQVAGFLTGRRVVVRTAQRPYGDSIQTDVKDVKASQAGNPSMFAAVAAQPVQAPSPFSVPMQSVPAQTQALPF